jgi:outer membrane protein TolC
VNQALAGYRPQVFIDGALEGARGETGRQPGASSSEGGLGGGGLGGAASTSRDGSTTTKRTTKQIGLSLRQSLYAGGSTGAEVRRARARSAPSARTSWRSSRTSCSRPSTPTAPLGATRPCSTSR